VPGAPIHDVEFLATLIGAGVKVKVAAEGLQHPLGVLELHLLILVLLKIHLLFSFPLAGRRVVLAQLLLPLTELLRELLDISALSGVVVRGVMHRAPCASIVTIERFMGVLVILQAMAPTSRCWSSCSSMGTSQRLVVATDPLIFLLVVAVVVIIVFATALSSSTRIGLSCFLRLWGRWRMPSTALAQLSARLKSSATSCMLCVASFSSIFSSLTTWRNATTTEALEMRGMVL
jgi:hypothetical protein